MSKLVVLSFGNGDCEHGVQSVTLQIWQDSNILLTKSVGSLPPTPEIPQLYTEWQLKYRQMGLRFRREDFNYRSRLEAKSGQVTNFSSREIEDLGQKLKKCLNEWLKSEGFFRIWQRLLMNVKKDEEIRLIIETESSQIRLLPWHLWEFIETHPKSEIALSPLEFERPFTDVVTRRTQARILAILGDSTGIDVEADQKELENLGNVETVILAEPTRKEVSKQLWDDRGWDILFFAGHSLTEASGTEGKIFINSKDFLKITSIKNTIKKAISRGLKLAIFNSCDGLGIASELAALHVPQAIVMREPVPDLVAQEFLKYFLEAFSRGESLYLAVREARERLESIEDEFPCASWLPVICQNPTEEPLSWQELVEARSDTVHNEDYQQQESNAHVNSQEITRVTMENQVKESLPKTYTSQQLKSQVIAQNYMLREQQIAEHLTARNLPGLFDLLLELKGLHLGDRYTLRWLYAVGGQSIIYLAEDTNGQIAIVKMAFQPYHKPAYISTKAIQEARTILGREASILQQLQNTAMPEFYDLIYATNPLHSVVRGNEIVSQEPYLVMEFIQGKNLLEIARKAHQNKPTNYEALEVLAWEVAATVTNFFIEVATQTQTQRYLYSDLNPRNLILANDLKQPVRILDAGSLIPMSSDVTVSLPFTEAYVPPEFYEAYDKGEMLWPTLNYVMYTLGKTLWEILSNRQPYPGENPDMSERTLINYSPPLRELILNLISRQYTSFDNLKLVIDPMVTSIQISTIKLTALIAY